MFAIFRQFIGRVATGALVVLAVAVGMSVFAFMGWPFELASHFVFFYAVAAMVLTLALLFAGFWARMAVGLVIVVFCSFQLLPQMYPKAPPSGGKAMLRVGMANLNSNNRETGLVAAWIRSESPDVLVLLEVTNRWAKELAPHLKDYPHQVSEPRQSAFGMLIASKVPLSNAEVHPDPIEGLKLPSITCDLSVLGKSLHLVAVHPIPPTGKDKVEQRNQSMFAMADKIYQRGEVPILLAGDLNCTPWSPDFDTLLSLSNLRDSSLGRGLEWTWYPYQSLAFVGLPIDHFLHSGFVEVVDRRVGPAVGSDHRPMAIDVNILDVAKR